FMKKYNRNYFIGAMLVEYPYFKLSTIWDISYQIASRLTKLKNSKRNKYEALEKEFSLYTEKFNNLNLDWYKEINKIRNRIVHGGIKVTPFYLDNDDKEVKNRLCFQMYDDDLNDLIPKSDFYTNIYNGDINFADNYFAFYTSVLYSYLTDFFDFVLFKLCSENNLEVTDFDKHEYSDILEVTSIDDRYWAVDNMEKFRDIAINMLKLYKNGGCHFGMDRVIINPSDLEDAFILFKQSHIRSSSPANLTP
ncbi:TPA: hypothetical protein R4318_002227, partial [Pasteurella multocida]|nr:hypothetical protein [Pasteurella multocida]